MVVDTPAQIAPGTPVVVGSKLVAMPDVADDDTVVAISRTGDLLVIPDGARRAASEAVDEAHAAFEAMSGIDDSAISDFFAGFARRLGDDGIWREIASANETDVKRAVDLGRSTGRLRVSAEMRRAMIDGLDGWASAEPRIGRVAERTSGADYTIERRFAPLGVVAFVFEGRPNVFADGAGVVRNANAAVMRIGGDALGTALAIEELAIAPALRAAGLPAAAVRLVRSRDRAAAQALFTLDKVRLAVARGSGAAVSLLGSIAEQHGIPASLHGTGGAWVYVEPTASPESIRNVIESSLDRKVCNTLNVLVIDDAAIAEHGRTISKSLAGIGARIHAVGAAADIVGESEALDESDLGIEWEWDDAPELSVVTCRGAGHAVELINTHSPHFVASILTSSDETFEAFYEAVDVPYVGRGFTRWVDGQWAWGRPELGLTNWERGRIFGRSGILAGDDIVTIRDVFIDTTGFAPQHR